MAKGIVKHQAPSRIKYELSHPVISFRLSREAFDKLKQQLAERHASFADFVKEGLALQKLKVPDVASIKLTAYNEGYLKAKKDFEIWYYCARCKQAMFLRPNTDDHEALIEYMRERGWHHSKCP